MQAHDERVMRLALALGARHQGRTRPNPAVGAVVVAGSEREPVIVAQGITQPGGRPHAERVALAAAGAAARGATLYVSLEPCSHHGCSPPCVDAILASGVARVVSALEDPDPRGADRAPPRPPPPAGPAPPAPPPRGGGAATAGPTPAAPGETPPA